jgi:hypothetical protein
MDSAYHLSRGMDIKRAVGGSGGRAPPARDQQRHTLQMERRVSQPLSVQCGAAESARELIPHRSRFDVLYRGLEFRRGSGTPDLELTSSSYAADVFWAISVQL